MVVTGDSGARPFILVPSSFGGIFCVKHYALRLHVMFSNNLKHFKKYRIMHSHHFKLYDKETNGKKKDRVRLCGNLRIPWIMAFSAHQTYILLSRIST